MSKYCNRNVNLHTVLLTGNEINKFEMRLLIENNTELKTLI